MSGQSSSEEPQGEAEDEQIVTRMRQESMEGQLPRDIPTGTVRQDRESR
jgi:hypothetical protein